MTSENIATAALQKVAVVFLRMGQIDIYRAVERSKRGYVIASHSAEWRGNPHRF